MQHDEPIYLGKSDIKSAFRLVSLSCQCWPWLIMMAMNPVTKVWQYFIDKCLPFGASISCAVFQRFSDVLRHIVQFRTAKRSISNYLHDFLFIAYKRIICNEMINTFIHTCSEISVPVAFDKTEWACTQITFLGILLDGLHMLLAIPEDKRIKAINSLNKFIDKKKATTKDLQALCGYLNFLNKAIYSGRVFMCHMYSKYAIHWKSHKASSKSKLYKLKPFHHVKLDREFKADCKIWLQFLTDENLQLVVNRPMLDLVEYQTAQELKFYSDASAASDLGFSCIYGK